MSYQDIYLVYYKNFNATFKWNEMLVTKKHFNWTIKSRHNKDMMLIHNTELLCSASIEIS